MAPKRLRSAGDAVPEPKRLGMPQLDKEYQPFQHDELTYSGSEDECYVSPEHRRQAIQAAAQWAADVNVPRLISTFLKGPFEKGWDNPCASKRANRRARHVDFDDAGALDYNSESESDSYVCTKMDSDLISGTRPIVDTRAGGRGWTQREVNRIKHTVMSIQEYTGVVLSVISDCPVFVHTATVPPDGGWQTVLRLMCESIQCMTVRCDKWWDTVETEKIIFLKRIFQVSMRKMVVTADDPLRDTNDPNDGTLSSSSACPW